MQHALSQGDVHDDRGVTAVLIGVDASNGASEDLIID
jgi:hypothetical protein